MVKYKVGDRIGPNNILFVSEVQKTNKKEGKERLGLFECPFHEKDKILFIASVSLVGRGITKSCGCLRKTKPANALNLTGKTFGRLTVLEDSGKRFRSEIIWKCKCSCFEENIVYIPTNKLTSGHTQSCGCLQRERASQANALDLTDKRFGMLVAKFPLKERHITSDGCPQVIWHCECDCGGNKDVISSQLTSNTVKSCGCKNTSIGEKVISRILSDNLIYYEKQKEFKDCFNPKTGCKLKFDFYLPDYNCCIEYDGEQHFREVSIFKETLEDIQYRDSIKNNYCKEHSIRLIRIPYTDFSKLNTDNYLLSLL